MNMKGILIQTIWYRISKNKEAVAGTKKGERDMNGSGCQRRRLCVRSYMAIQVRYVGHGQNDLTLNVI